MAFSGKTSSEISYKSFSKCEMYQRSNHRDIITSCNIYGKTRVFNLVTEIFINSVTILIKKHPQS